MKNEPVKGTFELLPSEKVEMMLLAGKTFTAPPGRSTKWVFYLACAAIGVLIGLGLPLYETYIARPLFGIESLPSGRPLVALLMPLILIFATVILLALRWQRKRGLAALESRLDRNVMVDFELNENGIRLDTAHASATCQWPAIRSVATSKTHLLLYTDSTLLYIPLRAFPDQESFVHAAELATSCWLSSQQPTA
ncbi:YcxB family protein [Rhizobium sp. L1K21]|uniref:YcxB family protein n=1 Tax=Rhizobium sp. L1K21 TaxID=2954933 RepID=UPI002093F68A|nr:YcxB family protein [Rhizobium sp. L1K21]MCO6184773.1 YcxB family protein [Rhizobium sp. L1K21]